MGMKRGDFWKTHIYAHQKASIIEKALNNYVSQVTWPDCHQPFKNWHNGFIDKMSIMAEMENMHVPNCTDSHLPKLTYCCLWISNLPAMETDAEPPIWHHFSSRTCRWFSTIGGRPYHLWRARIHPCGNSYLFWVEIFFPALRVLANTTIWRLTEYLIHR